jgi:hypothetical protein
MGFNNPTRELINEAKLAFRSESRLALLLSLGSGRPSVLSLGHSAVEPMVKVESLLGRMTLDCETIARSLSDQLLEVEAYARLNVDQGLEDLKVDDWSDLGKIEAHTRAYLKDALVNQSITEGSQKLRNRMGSITLGQLSKFI